MCINIIDILYKVAREWSIIILFLSFLTYSVVGDVRTLNSQNVATFSGSSYQYFDGVSLTFVVEVSFDQAYFMTGVQLWTESAIDVDLLLQAKYSDNQDNAYYTIKKVTDFVFFVNFFFF